MARRLGAEPIYEAAELWRRRCLVEGRSFLWPDHQAWTPENITALWDAFIGNPDTGKRTFYEKWEDQLANEPKDIHRVAADVVTFYNLFPSNVLRDTKLADVRKVIGWKLEQDQPDLSTLGHVYTVGVGNSGMHYLISRPWQVAFYLQFARELAMGAEAKDVNTYRELADEVRVRVKESGEARNIVLHLFFPERFERIVITNQRQRIAEVFADRAGGAEDLDDALFNIRQALTEEYGRENLDFYDEDIYPLWQFAKKQAGPTVTEQQAEEPDEQLGRVPLNTILYGPPGTGKTYSVQRRALKHLRPELENPSDSEVSALYRKYLNEGRIEFVTFHPSYSYEEFVEGYRYDPDAGVPKRHDGAFKRLVNQALNPRHSPATGGARIWKVSLGGSSDPHVFERSMDKGEIAIGWIENEDLSGLEREDIVALFEKAYGDGLATNSINSVNYLVNEIRDGDYVAVLKNQREIRAIGVVSGEYRYKGEEYGQDYPHTRPVEWLDQSTHDIYALNGAKNLTLSTIYPLSRISLQDFVELLPEQEKAEDPYVLIIDEINRGNISRIFGELITLLEEDKRRGASNELSARLPYSEETFSVPSNLYVIGTMNTADRSIALIDVALRRRFEFVEMMPDVEVIRRILSEHIEGADVEASMEHIELVCGVFEVLNKRITVLMDRDHQIGHSYFLDASSMDRLHQALYRRVFPLLQEYFYNDREPLRRLLGQHNQAENTGFVAQMDEYKEAFADDVLDEELPWEFHVYPVEELESALRGTFLANE